MAWYSWLFLGLLAVAIVVIIYLIVKLKNSANVLPLPLEEIFDLIDTKIKEYNKQADGLLDTKLLAQSNILRTKIDAIDNSYKSQIERIDNERKEMVKLLSSDPNAVNKWLDDKLGTGKPDK